MLYSDAGIRFKFRSGTHGLHEELGRHRGREGRKESLLCDAECECVSHVLWDCPAYRSAFMLELRRELGNRFERFQSLDSFVKSSYVLGSEAWDECSSGLLSLIKDFVLSVWEERKVRLDSKARAAEHSLFQGLASSTACEATRRATRRFCKLF